LAAIARVDVLTAVLPFRVSFGHALAERRSSTNVYVKVTLDDGSVGYGEGVPREYVTGETIDGAVRALADRFAPALLGRAVGDADIVPTVLGEARRGAAAPGRFDSAAWCALELAALDAFGKAFDCSVCYWLGGSPTVDVYYDAIVPFVPPYLLAPIGLAVRALGYQKVKIKVGSNLDDDLRALRILRRVLGGTVDLRVDANCAWTVDQALFAIRQMRPYRISAVEQPVAADDFEGLRTITAATPETIIVDESLRSEDDARRLVEMRACDAFNLRVSKCGGLLATRRIGQIASDAGLACVVGAQVGESGLLSAAGRHLAASLPAVRYIEGSAGRLLLKDDLTVENVLPGRGGRARTFTGPGLGVRVKPSTLEKYGQTQRTLSWAPTSLGVAG
jgi:L-alanine-DL-glutamate epimerase-like enolase superfamily enzyme